MQLTGSRRFVTVVFVFLTLDTPTGLSLTGASIGGIFTSIAVPALDALFDVGLPVRAAAGLGNLFLSHGHVDHVGALPSLLGIRGLLGQKEPMRVFAPAPTADVLCDMLAAVSRMHRWPLEIRVVPMEAGQIEPVSGDLHVRAFRTFHPVPSLGYVLFRRIKKLRAPYLGLPGHEIAKRKSAGEDLFSESIRDEFAFATDTLPDVLKHEPSLFAVRTLVMECTFLDERKSVAHAREGCHIHLDELLTYAHEFHNQALVLMHVSQIYKPGETHEIVRARWPSDAPTRPIVFAPSRGAWQ